MSHALCSAYRARKFARRYDIPHIYFYNFKWHVRYRSGLFAHTERYGTLANAMNAAKTLRDRYFEMTRVP